MAIELARNLCIA